MAPGHLRRGRGEDHDGGRPARAHPPAGDSGPGHSGGDRAQGGDRLRLHAARPGRQPALVPHLARRADRRHRPRGRTGSGAGGAQPRAHPDAAGAAGGNPRRVAHGDPGEEARGRGLLRAPRRDPGHRRQPGDLRVALDEGGPAAGDGSGQPAPRRVLPRPAGPDGGRLLRRRRGQDAGAGRRGDEHRPGLRVGSQREAPQGGPQPGGGAEAAAGQLPQPAPHRSVRPGARRRPLQRHRHPRPGAGSEVEAHPEADR